MDKVAQLEEMTPFALLSKLENLSESTAWCLVQRPEGARAEVLEALQEEAGFQGLPLAVLPQEPLASLPQRVTGAAPSLVLVEVTPGAGERLGQALESARSRYPMRKQVVLLLSGPDAEALLGAAPHFASFVETVTLLASDEIPALSPEDRESRLQRLREAHDLSDEEVLRMAEAHTLSPDPDFAEWLILLHRADLVG